MSDDESPNTKAMLEGPNAPTNLELHRDDLHDDPSRPFAHLLDRPQDAQLVFQHFHDAIARSFVVEAQEHPLRIIRPTRNEMRRRFKICEAWFRHARMDLGYSTDKACDLMYRALRAELDGVEFDPSKSPTTLWTPS